MSQHTTPADDPASDEAYNDEAVAPEIESRWRRRSLLRAVGAAGAAGLTAPMTTGVGRAEHETDPCPVTIDFNRTRVARVFDVAAEEITDLTVFYFDRDGEVQKQEAIDPTTNVDYGAAPLRVRYDADEDKTTIQIGGPDGAIRRVVAFGPDCRSAKTNPLDEAAGNNEEPIADFSWEPDPGTLDEPVTFTSEAEDPDGELIHHGWDIDDDGTEDAAGEEVTHTFTDAGEHAVTHTVVDDFDATNSESKTVLVNAPPTADFTWKPDPGVAHEPVTFTSMATDPDGELIHHGWDIDDDGTEDAAGQEVSHTFVTAGEHAVTHTVIDDFDARDSITKSVTVRPGPRGFVSASYGPDYNRCVVDLEEQFEGENGLDIGNKDLGFGIKHPKIPDPLIDGNHVQGVARLRDSGGLGRMVITNSGTSSGFRLAFQDVADADGEWFASSNTLPDSVSFDIRNVTEFGNHGHPGGVQAQGDIVVVAMESGDADHAAIYFLKIDGKDIEHVQTFWLDGSRGEPLQADQNNAATVGLVKLASNNHLLAVSGANHGRQGIWFYESTSSIIDGSTDWEFISFYEPTSVGYGEPTDQSFVGAGGGLNLVTECSGRVYLLAMHGHSPTPGDEFEFLQVFRVSKNRAGEIQLTKVLQQRDNLGKFATNSFSFRWAGSAYGTKSGRLAIMNAERRRNVKDNDFVNGHIYLGKDTVS